MQMQSNQQEKRKVYKILAFRIHHVSQAAKMPLRNDKYNIHFNSQFPRLHG